MPCVLQLQYLDLECNGLEELPACVAVLTTLTGLRLVYNDLTSLPPGPYLHTLTHLDIADSEVK